MTSPANFIDSIPNYSNSKNPVIDNLRWRVVMREMAAGNEHVQACLKQAAFDDVLFWFNGMCFCFEPRSLVKIKPFVLWPHQIPVVYAMDEAITKSERTEEPIDVVVDKSRGQGATWLYLMVLLRRWLRDSMFSVGLVTRNEDLVDSVRDPDTLMWKVVAELEMLPFWMLPKGFDIGRHRSLTEHSLINPEKNSTIVGYSATGDVGRGGRKSVFAIDELGSAEFIRSGKDYSVLDSTQHVTNCRIIPSTFGADVGAFYEMTQEPGNAVLLKLDWRDNPTQNKLTYVMREGVPQACNQNETVAVETYFAEHADELKKLERRGFVRDGVVRSPWYDRQCLRPGTTPRGIARELDRNPRGAVGKVFQQEVLDNAKKSCLQPVWQGKLVFNNETLALSGLIKQDAGPLKLWFTPGPGNEPPTGKYVLGCDISAGGSGNYSSNSVICGVNRQTGEQLLELAVMGLEARKFARLCVAVAKWLNNAYLGWEDTGPTGTAFGKEVLEEIYYANVYYREVAEIGSHAKSRSPGWHNGRTDDQAELFENLGLAFDEGVFVPRSDDLISECGQYEWVKDKIVFKPAQNHEDIGRAHGDRCVAAGVAWLLCRDSEKTALDSSSDFTHNPPVGSIAWLDKRREDMARKRDDDEYGCTLADLVRGESW